MLTGILSALLMLATILLEETVLNILPQPWRLIPISLILALALMHRVSFEIGAVFIIASTSLAVFSGIAPPGTLIVALICTVAAYGLVSRVFARRSLVAFGGLSLVIAFTYLLLRFGILTHVAGLFPWMILFCALTTALLAVVASLALEWILSGFGKRFVTKNETYEVRSDR